MYVIHINEVVSIILYAEIAKSHGLATETIPYNIHESPVCPAYYIILFAPIEVPIAYMLAFLYRF